MKLEIVVIIFKLLCVLGIGLATTLGSNLAQWANSDSRPSPIMWTIIIAACIANAGKDVISFLSQSFGDFKAQVRANAGQPPMPPPPAQVPEVGKIPIAPGPEAGKVQP